MIPSESISFFYIILVNLCGSTNRQTSCSDLHLHDYYEQTNELLGQDGLAHKKVTV